VWDTGGQDRFKFIIRSYFNEVSGVLLVYDITNRESFLHLQMWLEELERYQFTNRIILVGCKTDMERKREFSIREATEFSQENNFLFQECSAKNDDNINLMFEKIVLTIKDDIITGKLKPSRANGITIDHIANFSIIEPSRNQDNAIKAGCCNIL
jgi:GTPase SAR1 family protein